MRLEEILEVVNPLQNYSTVKGKLSYYKHEEVIFEYSTENVSVMFDKFNDKMVLLYDVYYSLVNDVNVRQYRSSYVYDPLMDHMIHYHTPIKDRIIKFRPDGLNSKYKPFSKFCSDEAYVFQESLVQNLPFDSRSVTEFIQLYWDVKKFADAFDDPVYHEI